MNIAQKLGPFLIEESGVSKQVVEILKSICSKDAHNTQILKQFIKDFGDHGIKREMTKYPDFINTLN